MKLELTRKVYKAQPDLYKLQYIKWDSSKKAFIEADKKDFKVEIYELNKIPLSEKKALLEIIKFWINEIDTINVKDYGNTKVDENKTLYKSVANSIIGYISDPEFSTNYLQNTYFCCCIKNKNLYLSIGIFAITIDKKNCFGDLEISLAYPQSQSKKNTRKYGTFGACGHNSRITMINYIFQDYNVEKIISHTINNNIPAILKKLGFKESKYYKE